MQFSYFQKSTEFILRTDECDLFITDSRITTCVIDGKTSAYKPAWKSPYITAKPAKPIICNKSFKNFLA